MDITRFTSPATKKQIKAAAGTAFEFYNPEDLIAVAVRMEAFAAELRALTKGETINADDLENLGVKVGETTRYDYSNSPAYVYLTQKLESLIAPIKAQIKDVEAIAKALQKSYERGGATSAVWADTETGEVFEVRPAIPNVSNKFELK